MVCEARNTCGTKQESVMADRLGLGKWSGHIATAVTLATTNWPLLVGAVGGVIAMVFGWATDLVHNQVVQAGAGTFVVLLWTCLGVAALADRRRPRLIRSYQDFEYGLTFEGCTPLYVPNSIDGSALQFGLQIRNFTPGPIRVQIESFHVIIGTRTLPLPKKENPSLFMPRGAGRVMRSQSFKMEDIREFLDKRVTGTVDFAIMYGHVEKGPVRRFKTTLEVVLEMKEQPPTMGYADTIIKESDEPYP